MQRRVVDLRRLGRRWWRGVRQQWAFLLLPLALIFAFMLLLLLLSPSPNSTSFLRRHRAALQETYVASIIQGHNISDQLLSAHSLMRQLTDQISLAKNYIVIAKESSNLPFAAELGAQVRLSESLLSQAAAKGSALTAEEAEKAIHRLALLLFQAQQLHYDSSIMIMKLKGQIYSLEEKSKSEAEKSTKFGQIAAEELPKGLYCLGTKLIMEWFNNPVVRQKSSDAKGVSEKLTNTNLLHFCVFSDNILAVSVVVNSTAVNSLHPERIVFHVVTDEVNYVPMKAWFAINTFWGTTVEIQKVEDFTWLNSSYVPVLKQLQDAETQSFYFSSVGDRATPIKFRNPKYLSMLNHLRFYIPEIYPQLKKVVFLDDDVVVQKDLTLLFRIELNGNVMGAVETCMETFHRFHKYLNYSHPLIRAHFDPDACGWAFGMNVIDLEEWRRKNVTGIYHYWQEKNADHTLWKLGSLPPGLLTFYGLVQPLDAKWHVLGLGYTNVDPSLIKEGAVLHYNGNMKPWLKIGMEKYKGFWDKYVNYSHPSLQQCLVH